jgi:CheY-like chemotaxis protein
LPRTPEALTIYSAQQASIAFVLLDVRMPGMDGLQTLAELRKVDPTVCCCFMGGDVDDTQALLAVGAAAVLLKGFIC